MTGEKKNKQESMDGKTVDVSDDLYVSAPIHLDASNPALYTAPGQKFSYSLPDQSITSSLDKYLRQSSTVQRLIDATDRLLRPSAAIQAVIDATQQMMRPSREIEAFLQATDRALQPSRQIYAAMAATERMLKPSPEVQALLNSTGKWLQPSSEMQDLASWTEKLARAYSQHHAASFEAVEKALHLSDSLKSVIAAMDTHRSTSSLRSLLSSFETLQASPIFDLLVSTDPTRLQSLIEDYQEDEERQNLVDAPPTSYDVEAEIVQALNTGSNPQKLTAPALVFLMFFITAVHTFYDDLSKWNDFRESVCDMQERLEAFESLAHARKLVRSALCDVPKALTERFRLTKKEGINLREDPGMKAEVIMALPKYAPLEVVDASNRDWLLVIYKHEGLEIEGWVSRKHVRPASR
ncbi:SH3 domain-containing protein [Pseudomonas sp. P155]|uniref:SH3 domain-containing protein n=1 Tax=Pseudomonas neuropathica TaxID=2730425 RepID=A0ABS0BR52_9PSED|nr:SH3 domain-containing protein [Pseudomonas neuropathica]MBF6036818.1 SH3 domain-containing protein [Pseudomonas neuropathica]